MSLLKEPFRLFFPLAVIYLLLGVALWLPQIFQVDFYPVSYHRLLVINGYLSCMIYGFLMTALPQYTSTSISSKFELILAVTLGSLPLFVGWLPHFWVPSTLSLLQAVFLIFFVSIRFLKMSSTPPYSFIFIPVALALWIYSETMFLITRQPENLFIFYDAATLALILGIGTRLIPGLLGHQEIVAYQRKIYENQPSFLRMIPKGYLLMVLVFALSVLPWQRDLSFLRVGILTTVALSYWRIFTFPTERSSFSWSIWLCCWGLVISHFGKLFLPQYGIHILHAHLLIGVVLLSLLVGLRVIRAHILKNILVEKQKKIYLLTFLVFVTASTRVSAPFLPKGYENHLTYSSLMLIVAIGVWVAIILTKKKT